MPPHDTRSITGTTDGINTRYYTTTGLWRYTTDGPWYTVSNTASNTADLNISDSEWTPSTCTSTGYPIHNFSINEEAIEKAILRLIGEKPEIFEPIVRKILESKGYIVGQVPEELSVPEHLK